MVRASGALLVAFLAAPATARERPAETITVLGAASLSEVLPALARVWPSSATAQVAFSFDASARLAKQAEAGVSADAFVSADVDWMDYLQKRGFLRPGTRRTLAGNRLVLVEPSSSALKIDSPRSLLAVRVRRVALAGETVPAGRYAQEALMRENIWSAVAPKVVRGDSVRGALRLAALGEADAAVVYATDAAVEPRVRVIYVFPQADHAPIVYPAAVLRQARRPDLAGSFLDFCSSPAARPIWAAAGFMEPAP